MRFIYTLLLWLATPVVLLHMVLRSRHDRRYRQRWAERFGFFRAPPRRDCLWLHAVSVGEVNLAAPLVNALLQSFPDRQLVVTTSTPTGSARVREQFGERVFHVYLPFDLPFAVRRFVRKIRPCIGIIMETEIWPNLYRTCHHRHVPLIIANARLSAGIFANHAGPVRALTRMALADVTHVAAQSDEAAGRYRQLGVPDSRITVTGNMKYDMTLDPALVAQGRRWRAAWHGRPVWIMASTHEGEDAIALDAHAMVLQALPDALLILVPRHPERFAAVGKLIRSRGLTMASLADNALPDPDTPCLLGDVMGRLVALYAASDVACVGGSFVPVGGHNLLEPAALELPILVGPHTENFADITSDLLQADAAARVSDADALAAKLIELLSGESARQRMGTAAGTAFGQRQGAMARTLAIVRQALAGKC